MADWQFLPNQVKFTTIWADGSVGQRSLMKILVISFAGIGDSLLATTLIRALREQYPVATIDALVMWAGGKDLLEGNPCLHTIYQQNFLKASALKNLRFLWRLRNLRYDISINTYP